MTPTTAVDGRRHIKAARELADRLLEQYIPSDEVEPRSLHAAMRYSIMAGGKRLRPVLALSTYEYCGGDSEKAPTTIHPAMAALEMVHTYSLIHDDLPCMDDDDLRRGIPTCHKEFGEAVATLAGDALHVIAFQLTAETGSTDVVLEMLGGQVADLEAEGQHVSPEEIAVIHSRKTGALIRGSVRIGAILAGAQPDLLTRLTTYGEKVGLAFQIIDDILDVEGDRRLLGKDIGSDSRNHKATYPGVLGVAESRRQAAVLIDDALAVFDPDEENILKFLARYIGQRES